MSYYKFQIYHIRMKRFLILWIFFIPYLAQANFNTSRSYAMGGTGVANSPVLSAAHRNPALVAYNYQEEKAGIDFLSLHLESLYLRQMAEDLQNLNSNINIYNNNYTEKNKQNTLDALDELRENTYAKAELGAHLGIAAQTKFVSLAFYMKNSHTFTAFPDIDQDEVDEATFYINNDTDSTINSDIILLYHSFEEYSITVANPFSNLSKHIFVGITLKYQRVMLDGTTCDINGTNDENSMDDINQQPDEFFKERIENADIIKDFNANLGILYEPRPNLTLGFMVENLIPKHYKIKNLPDPTVQYWVNPVIKMGLSYTHQIMTYNFDFDVNPKLNYEKFENTLSGIKNASDNEQYARFGSEANFKDAFFIRAGYSINFHAPLTKKSMLHAGLGIAPNSVLRIDLAVGFRDLDNLGAGVSVGGVF